MSEEITTEFDTSTEPINLSPKHQELVAKIDEVGTKYLDLLLSAIDFADKMITNYDSNKERAEYEVARVLDSAESLAAHFFSHVW